MITHCLQPTGWTSGSVRLLRGCGVKAARTIATVVLVTTIGSNILMTISPSLSWFFTSHMGSRRISMSLPVVVNAFSVTTANFPSIPSQRRTLPAGFGASSRYVKNLLSAKVISHSSTSFQSHCMAFGQFRLRMTSSTASKAELTTDGEQKDVRVEWTTDRVRQTFIEYFVTKHGHTFQPSSGCVPLSDPTLLFTNAGMNQFKPIFLGQADPASKMASLKRAVNSQKCIRAGGKHNDLDDVGRDTYHHTFFEMLGSWSFGDYFKEDAINFAWDILTSTYKLDPERMYATYFEGDEANGIPADTEARDYWLQYLPPERVLACSAKDNFWEMGDTGPCGPCTEIHYDRIGNGRNAASLVNADDPNVIEIWNLVFIQYNRESATKLALLPAQHVDTGMGLERLVSILQNKSSNYDIDCFQPIFEKLATMTDLGPYTGIVDQNGGNNEVALKDTAYRVIADHARTLSFAIADGAVPNNEGRGYVLRRILRRATRYGQQILHCPPGFFSQLVPVVVDTFGPTYPELVSAKEMIVEIIQEEESAFSSMLERGIKYFQELQQDLMAAKDNDDVTQNQRNAQPGVVNGKQAFFMYDTLGFPIDLTELMARDAGLTVDTAAFHREMDQQKERSRAAQRAARAASDGAGVLMELLAEQTAALADQGLLPTDDSYKYDWYDDNADAPFISATVLAIYKGGDKNEFLKPDDSVSVGEYVGLVLDKTTFYAEGGGQEADTGVIRIFNNEDHEVGTFLVSDVQVYAGYILHKGIVAVDEGSTVTNASTLKVGMHVKCYVDYERRRSIAPNHSMTHVLNAALRQVLGPKVEQRGSLCNADKLRFDFSHKQAMTVDELEHVEQLCRDAISKKLVVSSEFLPLDDALKIDGVRAVFGESYPDPVRVVTIGSDTSIEFCGGTHLVNTKDAQEFVLVEETAVAKGIRRITAVTKSAAVQAVESGVQLERAVTTMEAIDAGTTPDLDKLAGLLRKELDTSTISAPLKMILRSRIEAIQKKASDASKRALQQRIDKCLNEVRNSIAAALNDPNKKFIVMPVDIGSDSKASQTVINTVKGLAPNSAFLGVSLDDSSTGSQKAFVFAYVPSTLHSVLKADEWIREVVSKNGVGGRGGGKPTNAQGQIPDCPNIDTVVECAQLYAQSKMETKIL